MKNRYGQLPHKYTLIDAKPPSIRSLFIKEMYVVQGAAVSSHSIRTSHNDRSIVLAENGKDSHEEDW